jgi:hypothetical protein
MCGSPLRWILAVSLLPRHCPLLGDKAFASGQVTPLAAVTARVYSLEVLEHRIIEEPQGESSERRWPRSSPHAVLTHTTAAPR